MADASRPSARWLIVVSARSQPLFEYLSRRLAGTRDIEVILERRHGERRTAPHATAPERRRADRRTPRGVQRFPLIGYEIVRLAPPGPPRGARLERAAMLSADVVRSG
jgi:hypothetical protein